MTAVPVPGWCLASNNIPLDSPTYLQLEKLAAFGLIKSDFKGIRPLSRAEVARLLNEAEANLSGVSTVPALASEAVASLRATVRREAQFRSHPELAPSVDFTPLVDGRIRYLNLDGVPRDYERPVHDPGNDGVLGVGHGLRPRNPYPTLVMQRGGEGTPLVENNEGIVFGQGSNLELRGSSEIYFGSTCSALLEPVLLFTQHQEPLFRVNKGYAKLGGGGLELEIGRDANWFGQGYRGNVTLTNNARNFDLIKISSPEPVTSRYLWDLKYSLLLSQFERSETNGVAREPFFLAAKLSFKPWDQVELGFNFARQFGGPGTDSSFGDFFKGIIGGTSVDKTNSIAGYELRIRVPQLRNSEIFLEVSGEDSASFWPIVESYVAGLFIPRLTDGGQDDLRIEYFQGNQILYTHNVFPEGYIRYGLPVGHSQGGATRDLLVRYSHWFTIRNNLALEYIYTDRGDVGRVTVDSLGRYDASGIMQSVERKNAVRASWMFPLDDDWGLELMGGWERIRNFDLVGGINRVNRLIRLDLTYRY